MVGYVFFSPVACPSIQISQSEVRLHNGHVACESCLLLEKLWWKTVNELIGIESKIVIFKSLNELAPPYLRSLFRKNSQSTSYRLHNTSTDLRLPKNGIENSKKSFSFRGAKLWSSFSATCKQAASLSSFKQHILLSNERCSSNSYVHFLTILTVLILFLKVIFVLRFLNISFSLKYICILVGGALKTSIFAEGLPSRILKMKNEMQLAFLTMAQMPWPASLPCSECFVRFLRVSLKSRIFFVK